ncbi:hypothetical protein KTR66_14510 [Roseococcus sp. SDR]|uniref:hypothetical protein n=1 Tax=Roseococcus sp. SDR TaxID=2835532 RepID=UPI001BCF24B8|nr:hypothetical protein [Roseococcus sp. SDR]MBS7791213.1 hypothetical protein [Roseococcus sp. SDR]MBV1846527.1 hypothetical protein [Roseococcus sp. SDR]
MKTSRIVLAALALAGVAGVTLPAAAQQREICVAMLPFPPVPPATVSRLVVYQAYAVPDVRADHTLVSYRAQFQNQSAGTVRLTVRPVLGGNFPVGARWDPPSQTFTMTSYQPVDALIGVLRVPGQINQLSRLPDAWSVANAFLPDCPGPAPR